MKSRKLLPFNSELSNQIFSSSNQSALQSLFNFHFQSASVYSYSRVRDKMKIAEISLWVETGMQFILPLGALYA